MGKVKDITFNFRLQPREKMMLNELSSKYGMSRSAVVRHLMRHLIRVQHDQQRERKK